MLGGPMSFMLIRPEFPLENQGHKALWLARYKSNLRKIRRHHTTLGERLIIRGACSRTHGKGIGNRSCGPKFWKNDFWLRKTGGNATWGLGKRKPQEDRGINSGGRKRKKKKKKTALHRCGHRADGSRAAQKPSLGYWRNYYLSTSLLTDSPQITVECWSFQLWHKAG